MSNQKTQTQSRQGEQQESLQLYKEQFLGDMEEKFQNNNFDHHLEQYKETIL